MKLGINFHVLRAQLWKYTPGNNLLKDTGKWVFSDFQSLFDENFDEHFDENFDENFDRRFCTDFVRLNTHFFGLFWTFSKPFWRKFWRFSIVDRNWRRRRLENNFCPIFEFSFFHLERLWANFVFSKLEQTFWTKL